MSFVRDLLFGSPPAAPDYSPMANSNMEIARMNLAYAKEKDTLASADRTRLLDLTEKTTGRQMALAEEEATRSKGYYDDYTKTYQPLGQKLAAEATSFSTEAERNRIAGQAGADVAQAYNNAEGQQTRGMSRLGIGRPNANSFAAVNNQLLASKAGAIAGATTSAGFQARDAATNRMTNAVNVGNKLPGFSQVSSGLSTSGNAAAVSGANQTQGSVTAGYGVPSMYMNNAVNSNNSAANIMNTGFQNNQSNWVNQGMQTAAMFNAAGAAYGAYGGGPSRVPLASGGHISGPGTGISDSIHAMVSDGEYVIPADVVKRKGVEFFDKLLEKHHMPAAEQQRRYGIGGR
jgi:hypothetical protein